MTDRRGGCRAPSRQAWFIGLTLLLAGNLSWSLVEGERSVMADEPAAPQPFQAPGEARPIASASIDMAQLQTDGTLVSARWGETTYRRIGGTSAKRTQNWRQPTNASRNSSTPNAIRAVVAWSHVRSGGLSSYVRPATQLAPVDPLDDPFGDKARDAFRQGVSTTLQAEPRGIDPPARTPPAESNFVPEEDAAPPMPRSFGPLPPFPSGGPAPETNGRDCDEALDECREAQANVRENSIRNISIDVTPLLTGAQRSDEEGVDYEQKLETEISKAPSHVFRDRSGEVIGDGQLSDFRNGRVRITGEDGTIGEIPFADLSDEDMCFVAAWWSIPTECTLGGDEWMQRDWIASTLTWKASGVSHKPLYFEEVALERYGHSTGPVLQPFVSAAHFFGNVVALPYHLGLNPINENEYPLGHYRPGDCAPYLVPPVPISLRAGLLAAGAYTGSVFIIP
ncbi:MAG: hypothetical protein ACC628_02670 [Pirellulaceae bacterium]